MDIPKKHLSFQVPFKARKEHNHLVSCQKFLLQICIQESNTPLKGQFGTTLVFNIEKEMEHIARINKNWHSILK
jgi:hypothetical protein